MAENITKLTDFVFDIANKLRGPYRPPQYRKVMLPMTVLRRLDCVLAPTKEQMLEEYEKLKARGHKDNALHRALATKASKDRRHPLYNISPYTFEKLLADPENIASNLTSYIHGFSKTARKIFEAFDFETEIEKLDKANRLYLIVKAFADPRINLHPDHVSNHDMGYMFEELVRRFNEQANEEAGDHFTPREVITLMAHLLYTGDEDLYTPGIARTIYDPTAGTGGMLSVSEEYIKAQNPQAHLELFGQEYNEESWAICRSDLLIKDEPVDNIAFGDTLGDGETEDGHPDKTFHYMLANPPFGVEWKPEEDTVRQEHDELGFQGRFGPGLPRINDGATLFLLHMLSKMKPAPDHGGDGSKIAVVFNGSPLFNGEPGPSESNIRRWIIENDWLDTIIALPDQLFYNTGIYTYIWLVTNRKPDHRKGKVQLIDGTRHYCKMQKSLGNKRNKLGDAHIDELTRLYGDFRDSATCRLNVNGETTERVCSKIFDNRDFGYLKVTVERPLRLNFCADAERIERLWQQTGFINLAKSKKRKNRDEQEAEERAGKATQQHILDILNGLHDHLHTDRAEFEPILKTAFKQAGEKLPAALRKAIFNALSERDPEAAICRDKEGEPEPDTELRDTEIVPLPDDIPLPLPIGYEKDASNRRLLSLVEGHCEDYLAREVLPFVEDAWIDHEKTKVGYEIPINRHFYVYEPPRPLEAIEGDIRGLESEILDLLGKVTA
ncbi:class I SAM-dependent DNA methyltransferase [Guyparkeria sp. GHLCS8-2]|uniref:type I restriction-modification system subunit M n=1 Tax=Guyparkeria halopsychrophila TaxID=3139421 RepID=UPI0037C6BD05